MQYFSHPGVGGDQEGDGADAGGAADEQPAHARAVGDPAEAHHP